MSLTSEVHSKKLLVVEVPSMYEICMCTVYKPGAAANHLQVNVLKINLRVKQSINCHVKNPCVFVWVLDFFFKFQLFKNNCTGFAC